MGTGSSLQATNSSVNTFKNQPSVRERLQEEFGVRNDDEDTKEIGMKLSEMPGVFKAKTRFLKPLRRDPVKDTNIRKQPDNHALLKELYRRMDPSVVGPQGMKITGELELSVKYKYESANLLVKVGKAKNLKVENAHKLPDPFVQLEVLTARDEKASAINCQRTKQKWNSSKPSFQEILVFPLDQNLLADTKLKATVWSKDKVSEDDFLGQIVLELCKADLQSGLPVWYQLLPETDLSISGSIDVSITHVVPSKLMVTIHEAASLKATNAAAKTSNPYVRCFVTGIPERHESQVVNDTIDPTFDERFEFDVHKDELQDRVLVINVLSKVGHGKDKRLGDVQIPLVNLMDGSFPRTTLDLADLRNTRHARNKWSEEGLSAEFREAMRAHIVYQFPKFLFKEDHKGKKTMTVSSTKARSAAKMLVVNGFPGTH